MHHFDDDVNYPEVLQAITVGVQTGAKFAAELEEAKELLLELYDCIPASMADSCRETLQKVALFFRDEE